MKETHRGPGAVRPRVPGMYLVAKIAHQQYGSALFIRHPCKCECTSTSSSYNIESIQATLNGVTLNSYYIPTNRPFDFRSDTTDTPLQVTIGGLTVISQNGDTLSTNSDVTLVERRCDRNRLTPIHGPKIHESFKSARWNQGYNPDLSFVATSITHQCEKLGLEVILKSQHRPIAIKIKAAVSPQENPFRRRYNLKKADKEGFAKSVEMGITDIVPTPDNYGFFVDLVKKHLDRTIPVDAAQAIYVL